MISNSFSEPTSSSNTTDRHFKEAPSQFDDTVSCLTWTKDENPNLLLCGTWDGYVMLYKVNSTDAEVPTVDSVTQAGAIRFENPILSVAWQSISKKIIAGSIDGSIFYRDPSGFVLGNIKIGQHQDAVKGVWYLEESNIVCSVSYDKTMKFWDMRIPYPINTLNLGAKAVCSDLVFPNIAIGLSNEKLLIFDIVRDINDVFRNVDNYYIDSPFGNNAPLSAVSLSGDNTIGIGTYGGRSNVSKVRRNDNGTNRLESYATFKPHKIDPGQNGNTSDIKILYPIHAVGFHPRNRNTYFTAGGDGCVNIWDIPARNKLAFWTCTDTPITAAKYSPNGKLLAYAYGYDWAKGIEGSKSIQPKLYIHSTQLNEIVRE